MYLQRAIAKMVISAMLLALPTFLEIAKDSVFSPQATPQSTQQVSQINSTDADANANTKPKNIDDLSKTMNKSMNDISGLLGAMGYMMGMMFGLMAVMDFKRHAEEGGSYQDQDVEDPIQKDIKVNLEKKVENAIVPPIVDFKKPVQETILKSNTIKEQPLDFKNAELNGLVKDILSKVEYLKGHNYIGKDMEAALMVEKTESEYLFRIHKNYMDIPENKRKAKGIEDSPYDSTFKQLNLIITGLDEIENKIVKESVMKQKANEIFLKEKVAHM